MDSVLKKLLTGIFLLILFLVSRYNYLLFHSLVELFSIVIAFGIFVIGWNSRKYYTNNYLLFIGIAYLFVAFFDTLHTLAYKGMTVFKGYDDNNLPPQLWLAARYLESIALLYAPFCFNRPVRHWRVIAIFSAVSAFILYAIFFAGIFPVCFVTGSGLTPFKVGSEYLIDAILVAALYLLYRKKEHFEQGVLRLLTLSIVCTMVTELCFTVYVHLYGISNLVGHYFKVFAFWFMYHAIIETALTRPYDLFFTTQKTIEKVQAFISMRGWRSTEEEFFPALARFLAETLSMEYICIDRLTGDGLTARTVALYHCGRFEDNIEYALKDTPCGDLVGKPVCCFPRDVTRLFPNDPVLREINAESYAGITLWGKDEQPIGLIALIGEKPIANQALIETVLQYIAPRASGELDRELAQLELRESNERFSVAFNNAPVMISISSLEDGVYLDVNQRFIDISGFTRDEVIGRTSIELGWLSATDRNILKETILRDGRVVGQELSLRTKSGKSLVCQYWGETISLAGQKRLLSIAMDITEKRAIEQQFLQAQKMESVGRLAGGVAHDFNNMLGVIIGHSELAMMKGDLPNGVRHDLEVILSAAERSSDITRQLLAFSRQQAVQPKVLDLNDVISGMIKMLRRLIGEDIELSWTAGYGLWKVLIDQSQVDQILANLCVNARDAIAGGGRIVIQTENVTLGKEYEEVTPGDYVMTAVSDSGAGMSRDVIEHIFEPFYTTKELGHGTGLGLATVFGIVKQNNGHISVQSEPGEGTVFRIYLPARKDATVDLTEVKPKAVSGRETILLVEDEPAIMVMTRQMLASLGYEVLTANTPEEAQRTAICRQGDISLMITDVIMPGMNGRELAQLLLQANPEMKCLYMSGYTADVIADRGKIEDNFQFLQKPFNLHSLSAKVREVLDEG